MRLREREMPLDPEVERELEAIDRALGDEPVDPDLEALAQLARALREERVGAEPGFAAGLDRRVAEGFPRPGRLVGLRKRLAAAPPRRILAQAGAAATLLVVVGVGISQSDEIGGGGDGFNTQPAPAVDQPAVDATGGAPAGEARDAVQGASGATRDVQALGSNRERGRTALRGTISNFGAGANARSPAASTWGCRPRRTVSGARRTASSTWFAITAASSSARASPGAIPTWRGRSSVTRASSFGFPPGSCPPPWATSPTSATSSREPTGPGTSRADSCP